MYRQLGKTNTVARNLTEMLHKINDDHYLVIRDLHTKTIKKFSFDQTKIGKKYINVIAYYSYNFAQNHSEAELSCQYPAR